MRNRTFRKTRYFNVGSRSPKRTDTTRAAITATAVTICNEAPDMPASRQIQKTIYFPMQWKTPVRSMTSWEILPGNRDAFLFTPPAEDKHPDLSFIEGTHLYVLQCDFLMDGKPLRIYATAEVRQSVIPFPCSRDKAVFLGPVLPEIITDELLARLSVPGKKLEPVGTKSMEIWRKQADRQGVKSYILNAFSTDKKWINETRELFKQKKGNQLIALDFESPEEGKSYQLFCSPNHFREAWLNGEKLPKLKNKLPLKTRKGINRLILVRKPVNWPQTGLELAVAEKDPFQPVKCVQPEF